MMAVRAPHSGQAARGGGGITTIGALDQFLAIITFPHQSAHFLDRVAVEMRHVVYQPRRSHGGLPRSLEILCGAD